MYCVEIGEYQGQHGLPPKFPNTKQSANNVSIHIRHNTCFRQNFPSVANQKAMIFFLSATIFRYNWMLQKVQGPTVRNESLEGVVTKASEWCFESGKSHDVVLNSLKIPTLQERRDTPCKKCTKGHRLNDLLPPARDICYSLRKHGKYTVPRARTNRYYNSFVP